MWVRKINSEFEGGDQMSIAQSEQVGQKFLVNIEGVEYQWDRDTISTTEIRALGKLPPDQSVIEESPEGTERTLGEDEIVTIKPGHRHGRAAKYRRG